MKQTSRLGVLILFLCLLLLPGCRNDGNFSVSIPEDYPVMVGDVEIKACPQKVISLSPVATEIIFALGNNAQLIGVSDYDTVEGSEKLQKYGSTANPKTEEIIACKPDLVLISGELGEAERQSFQVQNIPVVAISAADNREGLKSLYETVGIIMAGKSAGQKNGANTVNRMLEKMEQAGEAAGNQPQTAVLFLTESAVATGETFAGWVLSCAGVENVAGEARNYTMAYEEIAKADPDIIFCDPDAAAGIKSDAILGKLSAVKENRLVEISAADIERQGHGLQAAVLAMAKAAYGQKTESSGETESSEA